MKRGQLTAMAIGAALTAASCATAAGGASAVVAAEEVSRGLDCAFLTESEAAASAGVSSPFQREAQLLCQLRTKDRAASAGDAEGVRTRATAAAIERRYTCRW